MRKNLTKKERLKSGSDFKRVFNNSKKIKCRGGKLFFMLNGLKYSRFGVTFKRNFGNAVIRNKQKRLSKEAYRHIKSLLNNNYDLVFLIYSPTVDCNEMLEKLVNVFKRAKIVKENK